MTTHCIYFCRSRQHQFRETRWRLNHVRLGFQRFSSYRKVPPRKLRFLAVFATQTPSSPYSRFGILVFLTVSKSCLSLFSAFGQALDRLVTVSSTCYHASTSVLSTSCSSRGLRLATGDLILRGASRLDAFSVYPVRTWLLCRAVGTTTDPPAVRPPRSSRTKGSSSQISCARAG